MPQIRTRIKTGKPENDFERDLEQELLSFSLELSKILNKGIDFTDNFNAQTKSYTTNGVANTEDAVAHTLGRVPTGYIVIYQNKAASLYDSGTTWTATNIYLKCSAASTAVKIIVF